MKKLKRGLAAMVFLALAGLLLFVWIEKKGFRDVAVTVFLSLLFFWAYHTLVEWYVDRKKR